MPLHQEADERGRCETEDDDVIITMYINHIKCYVGRIAIKKQNDCVIVVQYKQEISSSTMTPTRLSFSI